MLKKIKKFQLCLLVVTLIMANFSIPAFALVSQSFLATDTIVSVAYSNDLDAFFATGNNGLILKSTDDGASWTKVNAGVPSTITFAGSDNINNGDNWGTASLIVSSGLAYGGTDGNKKFIGLVNSGSKANVVYYSDAAGERWYEAATKTTDNADVQIIRICYDSYSNNFYGITSVKGVVAYSDGIVTDGVMKWTLMPTLTNRINDLVSDNKGSIYVISDAAPYLFKIAITQTGAPASENSVTNMPGGTGPIHTVCYDNDLGAIFAYTTGLYAWDGTENAPQLLYTFSPASSQRISTIATNGDYIVAASPAKRYSGDTAIVAAYNKIEKTGQTINNKFNANTNAIFGDVAAKPNGDFVFANCKPSGMAIKLATFTPPVTSAHILSYNIDPLYINSSTEPITFDNIALTINNVVVGSTVSEVVSALSLPTNTTASVYSAQNAVKADGDVIVSGDKVRLTNSAEPDVTRDYTVNFKYIINDDFDSYADLNLPVNSSTSTGVTAFPTITWANGSTEPLTGVSSPVTGGTALKINNDATGAYAYNLALANDTTNKIDANSIVAFEFDINTSNAVSLTLRSQTNSLPAGYKTIAEIDSAGLKIQGNSVSDDARLNEWNHILVIFDMANQKIYSCLNGNAVVNGDTLIKGNDGKDYTNVRNILMITYGQSEVLLDNFKVYNIKSADSIDDIINYGDTAVTSGAYTISNNLIAGAVGADFETFISNINLPTGASAEIFSNDYTAKITSGNIPNGAKLVVTAADGCTKATYLIDSVVNTSGVKVWVGGNGLKTISSFDKPEGTTADIIPTNVVARVSNISNNKENATLVVALYDTSTGNTVLENIFASDTVTLEACQETVINVPFKITSSTNKILKAFVISDFATLKPYSNHITVE